MMERFDDFLKEQLNDEGFAKEYEDMQPEMDIIRAMIKVRKENHLTQKDLEKRTGIHQADLSKLEKGTRNPTLGLLKRLADGMGMTLRIQFIPKNKHVGG